MPPKLAKPNKPPKKRPLNPNVTANKPNVTANRPFKSPSKETPKDIAAPSTDTSVDICESEGGPNIPNLSECPKWLEEYIAQIEYNMDEKLEKYKEELKAEMQ